MDPAIENAIDKIHAQIGVLEEQIVKKKEAINTLCETEDAPLLYPDVQKEKSAGAPMAFRSDQFFGRPLATAVREILEQRAMRNLGAVSLNELYDVMKAGGFDFENSDEKIARRNLSIALSKNPSFMRVTANNHIGLTEWYPNAKKRKPKSAEEEAEAAEQQSGAKLEVVELDERNLARNAK